MPLRCFSSPITLPKAPLFFALCLLPGLVGDALFIEDLSAQASDRIQAASPEVDRIWGRITTVSGQEYEGFIRWDRNEGSWVDLLDGSKDLPEEHRDLWATLSKGDEGRERIVEVGGVRIAWDDYEDDYPLSAESGIRFGHLEQLRVLDTERVELVLRSGDLLELEGGATDLGPGMREFIVDVPGRDPVELVWDDLEQIEFGDAPQGARPRGERLYGTVEDQDGGRHSGYISWDLDEIFATDTLNGEQDGSEREIVFSDISRIERTDDGTLVELRDGRRLTLTGSNDVDRRNRGIQISDPGLGMLEVEWRNMASVRFHSPDVPVGRDTFDGGHRLRGTVVDSEGEEYSGWIRWDADEDFSWEVLNGEWGEHPVDIEFGNIASIERTGEMAVGVTLGRGATVEVDHALLTRVTLLDGRVLDLTGSNDVDEDNKGILIQLEADEEPSRESVRVPGSPGRWVRVPWSEFRSLRFEH